MLNISKHLPNCVPNEDAKTNYQINILTKHNSPSMQHSINIFFLTKTKNLIKY